MMGRCPVGGGKCDKECAVLQVEDELECSCGCSNHLHQECSLKSASHTWNSESCECHCKDQTAQRQCMETPGKVWDSSSCSCICQAYEPCFSGLVYNHDSCLCEPTVSAIEDVDKSEVVREDRDSLENSNVFYYLVTHWIEVVIIIVLATAIVILVIVIVILMRRLEKMRRVINKSSTSSDTTSDNTDIYLSNPAPDMDDGQIKQSSSKSTTKSTGQLPHKYF